MNTRVLHFAPGPEGYRLERRFTFEQVRPHTELVASAIGYPFGEVPEVLVAAIEAVAARGEGLWSIQGGCLFYGEVSVDLRAETIRVRGIDLYAGGIVASQLVRSTALGVFLCTAGRGIEDLARELVTGGDPFTGCVADAMGSLVVDGAMDLLQEEFGTRMADRGLRITNRYSPGYCGWHVSEQQRLFLLLPAGYCGVRLTDTSLMQPIKTVSGIIGAGPRVRFNEYPCSGCELEMCIYRDVKKRKTIAAL